MADPAVARNSLWRLSAAWREQLAAARPDALVVVAAEHFANFFMNNMPSFAIGMADQLSRGRSRIRNGSASRAPSIPGNAALSQRLIREMMQTVDVAYAEEWRFDHGIMVPLHFLTPSYDLPIIPVNINCQGPPLTPLHRAWALGEALRRAADRAAAAHRHDRHRRHLALAGDAGLGKDQREPGTASSCDRWRRNDKAALLSYTDEDTYRDAGQGGFEIRTFISIAAAARGRGHLQHYGLFRSLRSAAPSAVMDIAA